MLNLRRFSLLYFLLVCWGCSTDNLDISNEGEEQFVELPSITVLGNTDLAEYQTNISASLDEKNIIDLTEEIGIGQQVYRIEVREGLISYVTRVEGETSAWQRNILTEEIYTKQDYCPQENMISIFTASGSENYLTYLFESFEDLEDRFFLEVYNKNDDTCFQYDAGIGRPAAVQDFGSIYGIYRVPSPEERELMLVDLETDSPPRVIPLTSNFNFATINERQLYLFFVDGSYQIYDIESYTLVGEGSNAALAKTSAVGFLSTTFVNDQMVYYKLFPAPTSILFSPEIYDFGAEMATQPDLNLLAIKDEKERELSQTISFTDMQIDIDRNVVVIGYDEGGGSVRGGVIYTDFEGTVLNSVELPHYVRAIQLRE